MGRLRKEILTQLSDQKSYSVEEIYQALGFQTSSDFKTLVKMIATLEREHAVEMTDEGKIRLPQPTAMLEGTFRGHERGFGFVTLSEDEPDVFIPKGQTNYAMSGDTVLIDITTPANPWKEKAAEGKVVEIVKHGIQQVVGIFEKNKFPVPEAIGTVKPNDKKLSQYEIIIKDTGIVPEDGMVCVVEVTEYPNQTQAMRGVVTETLGHRDDPGVDILSIVIANGINPIFPDEVLAEAEQMPDKVDELHLDSERKDLRGEMIITIDGESTKDFDDAVQVKKLPNGNFELGVHIADVSYYVKEGSALDKEAFERGTSVYLTDRVIPMLPRKLSNGICSLNPKVTRYTLSCVMEINQLGYVEHYEIFPSIIKTTERMTYSDVNTLLKGDNETLNQRYQNLIPMLKEMESLHYILEKMRKNRGAISFEDNEASIKVDETGKPIDIVVRDRGTSERMIESFMLAANETVAHHFRYKKLPFIYRIHEQPDEKKMQRFFEFATNFGITIKGNKEDISPKALQKVLNEVKGKPEEAVVNTMLLRSMQQARYDVEPEGHYGLAAKDYTHFTSPIRRYPDLIVHRLIRSYGYQSGEGMKEHFKTLLPDIASHSSKMERRAVDAERETDVMKKAEYMMPFVGQTFKGVISSVVKFGLFVELPNTVEGLVHINTMDDYFEFNENHLILVGKRSQQSFAIGQEIEVKLVKADPETREIDFELAKPLKGKNRNVKSRKEKSQSKMKENKQRKKESPKKKGKKPFYKGVKKKKRHKRGGRH